MKTCLLVLVLAIAWVVPSFAQTTYATAPVLARAFVAHDVSDHDLLSVRDGILTLGGAIKEYALGDVFVILIDERMLGALSNLDKVVKVVRVAGSASSSALRSQSTQVVPQSSGFGGARSPTREEAEYLSKMVVSVDHIAPSVLARRRALLAGLTPGVGSSADNSLSPYFPPIGDQEGRSSCVAWAACYYWSTYTQAADEDVDVSGTWLPREPACNILDDQGNFDPTKFPYCLTTIDLPGAAPPRPSRAQDHIASPAFLYPLINYQDDIGASLGYGMTLLNVAGCGSWAMKPYDPWRFDSVVYDWPNESQWVEALSRRTSYTVSLDLTQSVQFDLLRFLLWNGSLAVTAHNGFQNFKDFMADPTCQQRGTCPGIDNDVLYSTAVSPPCRDQKPGACGGDAVTIVGYDDHKAYRNQTGQLREGAFLIATSGGPWNGTYNSTGSTSAPGPDPTKRGFFWVAYEYARAKQVVSNEFGVALFNIDRPHYRPHLYAASRLSGTKFGVHYRGGVGSSRGPLFVSDYPIGPAASSTSARTARSINADTRVVVDLTDGGHADIDWGMPVPPLFVQAGRNVSIADTDFFFDELGTGTYTRFRSPDAWHFPSGQRDAFACTDTPITADVNWDGVIDLADIQIIWDGRGTLRDCMSDRADINRDGRVDLIDSRKAVLLCSKPGCK